MGKKQYSREWIEKICAETWKEVYRFIYFKIQNREESEDITQETYSRFISYLSKRDIEVLDYSNYLKTIAMNILRDHWRTKKRKGSSITLEEANLKDLTLEDFTQFIEERTRIEEAMQLLTKEQRMVIELRIIKGYSVADTAKQLEKTDNAVRALQYRAVKALAQVINEAD